MSSRQLRQGLIDSDIYDRIAEHMVHIQNITNNQKVFFSYVAISMSGLRITLIILKMTPLNTYMYFQMIIWLKHHRGEFQRIRGSQMLDFCKETGLRVLMEGLGKIKALGSARM